MIGLAAGFPAPGDGGLGLEPAAAAAVGFLIIMIIVLFIIMIIIKEM